MSSMDYLEQCTDLRRSNCDPELFFIALALHHIQTLIEHGGSASGRPGDDSSLYPQHLEAFLAGAVEKTWKDQQFAQEWRRLQQLLPHVRGAWENGQSLFHEQLVQVKSNQDHLDYFSMFDFAVDGYAYMSASRTYPDSSILRDWAIIGYMVAWRAHFLKDQVGEENIGSRL